MRPLDSDPLFQAFQRDWEHHLEQLEPDDPHRFSKGLTAGLCFSAVIVVVGYAAGRLAGWW